MDFKDKVIVVTGGSRGFGKVLAIAFRDKGAQVVISSNEHEGLASTAKELNMDSYASDVTKPEQLKGLSDYALQKYGRIDMWVNNAGVQIAPTKIEDVETEKLQRLFSVNFFGYFYGIKAVIPIMRKQNFGIIININSTAGLAGKPGISAYVASKFAVKGLTESLREELKGTDVQVFGIYPGGMQTEIYKEQYPTDFEDYMSVEYAAEKIMDNFSSPDPEVDLIIKRPIVA
jgi:3-hydroxybutyrate dehydrogenase